MIETMDVKAKTKAAGRKAFGADVFTTGEIAEICGVARRTVSKWFDSGSLKGYRIPDGKDRRVTRKGLVEFMESNRFPAEMIHQVKRSSSFVLVVGCSVAPLDDETKVVMTAFEAGAAASELKPSIVVVDLAIGRIDSAVVIDAVRRSMPSSFVVAYGHAEERGWAHNRSQGFIAKTTPAAELVEAARAVAAKGGGK